jgi:hypothetical protein
MTSIKDVLEDLLRYTERNECRHEETSRGGSIWTICDECGMKWADDRGGFVPYQEPIEITQARKALATLTTPAPGRDALRERIAQALLDRFIVRSKLRGNSEWREGTKVTELVASYRDDFMADADAILSALPVALVCPACDGRGMIGGLVRCGDGDVDCVVEPCPECSPDAPVVDEATPIAVVHYTNWRGETSRRRIIPKSVRYGSTEWHPEPQWLLRAWDDDKQADREFALKDFGARVGDGEQ